MRQVATGGVPVEDLEHEQVDGRDGIQQARAPLVSDLATQGENRRGVENLSEIRLDMLERFWDRANHPGPPGGELS